MNDKQARTDGKSVDNSAVSEEHMKMRDGKDEVESTSAEEPGYTDETFSPDRASSTDELDSAGESVYTEESTTTGDTDSAEEPGYTDVDYYQAALLLSRTYLAMVSERENIRRWQKEGFRYTDDDAAEELISITAKSDGSLGVRVQTSGVSDQTGRIGSLLAEGYAQKKQGKLLTDLTAPRMLEYIAFLDWKIRIVETAMEERMTTLQKTIYQLLFFKRRTYNQLVDGNKGKHRLNDWKIHHEKTKAIEAVAAEIRAEEAFEKTTGTSYMKQVIEEVIIENECT